MKPLEDIVGEDIGSFSPSPASLLTLPETAGFERAMEFFGEYPERSLSGPESRALMHCLVRAVAPGFFLEIGTYFAGMTEVVARAMLSNANGGQLLTIDPFGNHRVPGILESWPNELSEFVSYTPLDSMGLFSQLNTVRPTIDVCFVDGNHLYEFAFYDLNCSALWMRPGGLVIMDDYDQPGVFWAAKHFLELNPGWREIGGVFDAFDPEAPFESIRPSIAETGFLILAAPELVEIGGKPGVFEHGRYRERAVDGYKLDLAPENVAGKVHAKIFLRSFYEDDAHGDPEQLEIMHSADVTGGEGEQAVMFAGPLATDYDRSLSTREVEINLVWSPSNGKTPLRLKQKPEPILSN